MNKQKFLAFSFMLWLLTSHGFLFGQEKPCGTSEMMEKYFEKHPELKQQYVADEQLRIQEDKIAFANNYRTNKTKAITIYTIPVVFHILHQGGSENISDVQIFDQMRILNEDFRKKNSDTSTILTPFKSIAADCEIQFQLAKKDQFGICTNGIDRIYSSETIIGDDGSKLNPWPNTKYLNIWVVKNISSGLAGYAYYPGWVAPSDDGVMIESSYIGSIGTGIAARSRSLTHEIGHYLNLRHTWGNNNSPGTACGDDGISDTPLTKGWTTCNLSGSSCGTLDNVQNFMEYSYCSKMFTIGQKTSMINALLNSIYRNNLWTASNLALTGITTPLGLCVADFKSNSSNNIICQGDSLRFSDLSWNSKPTIWSWSFTGGTPATSPDSAPTVKYNTPGIYNVSLTVADSSNSVSITKTGYITVLSSAATNTNSVYFEGFETGAISNFEWNVYNSSEGSYTWMETGSAAASGTHSVCLINSPEYDTHIDELISPPIDVSVITGAAPVLLYKVAYAKRTTSSNDKLQIYFSVNCGKTWSLRKTLPGPGDSLNSGGSIVSDFFVPNSDQWLQKTYNLSSWAAEKNLLIKFRFTSNGGNNIYLDDINITGSLGVDELSNNINLKVLPNPADDNSFLTFDLEENRNIEINIYDIFGREVSNVFKGKLESGNHKYPISKNLNLNAGIYFVRLRIDQGSSNIQKFIVK